MRTRTPIGVLQHPISTSSRITVVNVSNNTEFGGMLTQNYDATRGTYVPDRRITPTILALKVSYVDENSGSATETDVDWTDTAHNSIEWTVNGTVISATSASEEYYVDAQKQLVVRHNQQPAEKEIIIAADGTFKDSIGRIAKVSEQEVLTVIAGSDMSLALKRVTGDATMASAITVINVTKLMNYDADNTAYPWRVDRPAEWRRKCAVQLYNGNEPLPDAWTSADVDTPSGTAFYFWYYLDINSAAQPVSEAGRPAWALGTWYADGSMSRELTVDMRYADDVTVVCRAGFVPYGEYADYLDADGKINADTMWQQYGYREQRFHLWVSMPRLEYVGMAAMSHARLDRALVGSDKAKIIRRALVQADGRSVVDTMKRTSEQTAGNSCLERFFKLQWYKQTGNAAATKIAGATGEWLEKTPAELGATDAQNMPSLVLDVEPKTKAELLMTDRQVADGVIVTQDPQPGDLLFTDAQGEKVWVKNGDGELTAANVPSSWTHVGYVYHRGKTDIVTGEPDDSHLVAVINKTGTDEKYCDVLQYAWTQKQSSGPIVLDGKSHTKTFSLRMKDYADGDTIELTYSATTLQQVAAALTAALEAKQAELGVTADWWAYVANAAYEKDDEGSLIVIQCDAWSDYRQYNCSGCTFVTWHVDGKEMPASNHGGVRPDGGEGTVINLEKSVSYYKTKGKADTSLTLTAADIMTEAAFNGSTASDVKAYKATGKTYADYIAEYKLLPIPQPRRNGCFALPDGKMLSARYARTTAPTKSGGVKYKFPALYSCYVVGYGAADLGLGEWWLPGVHEALYLERDATLAKVGASAAKMQTTTISAAVSRWLAQRCSISYARIFNATTGTLHNYYGVSIRYRTQAVTLVRL